jgi:hypothetical protein
MSDEDLRELAEGATRGPWEVGPAGTVVFHPNSSRFDYVTGYVKSAADSRYIAAASPDRILGLLATLARVEVLRDRWARLAGEAMDPECREWLTAASSSLRAALSAPTHTEGVGR